MALSVDLYQQCKDLDYSSLPEGAGPALQNWVLRGLSPGDGLRMVLEADLRAILRFQDLERLKAIALWVYHELPTPLWGSPSKVRAWSDFARACNGRCA